MDLFLSGHPFKVACKYADTVTYDTKSSYLRFWQFSSKRMPERGFEELTRPPRHLGNNRSTFFVLRNRVGGPVVNETEHKPTNWNSDGQALVHVLYKGLVQVPMHGPSGLDSVPSPVKEVVVRSVVRFFFRHRGRAQPRNTPNAFANNTKPNINIECCR